METFTSCGNIYDETDIQDNPAETLYALYKNIDEETGIQGNPAQTLYASYKNIDDETGIQDNPAETLYASYKNIDDETGIQDNPAETLYTFYKNIDDETGIQGNPAETLYASYKNIDDENGIQNNPAETLCALYKNIDDVTDFQNKPAETLSTLYKSMDDIIDFQDEPPETLFTLYKNIDDRTDTQDKPAETLYALYENIQGIREIQDQPAVIFHDGESMHTMSHADLYIHSGLLSNELLSYSITHEIVCCLVGPGINLPALLLGILKVNSAFSILSTTDPNGSFSNILNYAPVQTVLLEKKLAKVSQFHLCECWTIAKNIRINSESVTLFQKIPKHCDNMKHVGGRARSIPDSRRKIAYVVQTSGTTGNPKVIQVPHHCILPNIVHFKSLYNVNMKDRIFMASPLTFDPSIIDIFLPVTSGACLVMVPDHVKMMPQKLGEILIDCQISILQTTPSFLRSLGIDFLTKRLLQKHTKLRVLAFGGEPCPSYEVLFTLKDPDNAITRVFNLYGITEVSCWAMCHEINFYSNCSQKNVPLGQPLSKTMIEVRNEDGTVIKKGLGQLFIGSRERRCYINEEVWSSEDYLYPTGDWVYLGANGDIFFRGRQDTIMKFHGKKINIGNIENTLDHLSEVQRHVVIPHPEKSRLSIFISLASAYKSKWKHKHAVNEALRRKNPDIPPFKMIVVPHIPLSAHGKVDHRKLLNYEAELEEQNVNRKKYTIEEINIAVSVLWKEFTGMKSINNDDNFILNGGNSISAVQFALEMESKFMFMSSELVDTLLNRTFGDVIDLLAKRLIDEFYEPRAKMIRTMYNCTGKTLTSVYTTHKASAAIPEIAICHKDATRRGLSTYCCCTKCFNSHLHITEPVLREYFKYNLGKCIDASPCLVHFPDLDAVICYIGSHSGLFSAINVTKKTILWESTLPGRIESSACISECGRYVFVGCFDYCLYSFDSQTGKICWKVRTGSEVRSSPIAFNLKVFVGSHDQNLYSIDIQTGTVVWKKRLGNGSIYSSPAISGTSICAAALNGTLSMLDTADGKEIWSYKYGNAFFSSPLIVMTNVFIAAVDGCLLKFDSTGKLVLRMVIGGPIFSSPVLIRESSDKEDDPKIVIGSQNSGLYCVSLTGKLIWTFPCTTSIISTPFIVPSSNSSLYIVFATTKGTLHLMNTKNHKQLHTFDCPAEVFSSPVVVENYLAIGCRDNNAYIFKF